MGGLPVGLPPTPDQLAIATPYKPRVGARRQDGARPPTPGASMVQELKTKVVSTQDGGLSPTAPRTWHHGLVAEWWAAFNTDTLRSSTSAASWQPGTRRLTPVAAPAGLLLPWRRAGYDVDGSDVSPNMIKFCRQRARAEGFEPAPFVQPLHQLATPRQYRTIVACGVFGLGTTRRQDQRALRRFYEHLEPGGTLLLDNQVPYVDKMRWGFWPRQHREGHVPSHGRGPGLRARRPTAAGTRCTLGPSPSTR